MDDAKPSLLYKVKPIGDRLPAVKRPEGHVHFRTKIMWVAVILVLYFVMSNVYIWGLDQSGSLDIFAQYRTIMAGASGTILQLGIGPIVTASIIMQLFVGAKIIKLDLSNKKDKACYQSVMKVLVLVMIFIEAVPQVYGYLVPSSAFNAQFGDAGAKLLIILQLFIGSYLVFLFDEVISKWGIGSGISLFIAAGVAQAVFTGALNWYPVSSAADYSLSNPPAGTIPKAIYILMNTNSADMASGGYEMILLGQPNPLIALIGTLVIFLVVVYLESSRIELPLAHGNARGARGKYPIKLMYASNIPVILMSALLANISMVCLLFYTSDFLSSIPLLGHNRSLRDRQHHSFRRSRLVPIHAPGCDRLAHADAQPCQLRKRPQRAREPLPRDDLHHRHGDRFHHVRQVLGRDHQSRCGIRRQQHPEERNADSRIQEGPPYHKEGPREIHPYHHHTVRCTDRSAGRGRRYDRYHR